MAIASPQIIPLIPGSGGDVVDWLLSPAGTYIGAWATDLAGVELLYGQIRFLWGAGSGGVRVCLQSSLDQGSTPYDVAVFDFAAVARTVIFAIRPVTSSVIRPGEGGIDASSISEPEGIVAAVLGERFRLKVLVSGTYSNTTLAARIIAS